MVNIQGLKFSKYDKFNNAIFIVNKGSDSFEQLKKYYNKISHYDTFLPIYNDENNGFCSIRFFKPKMSLTQNGLYDIDFKMCQTVKNGKLYLNCYINSINLISEPKYTIVELD